MSFNYRECMEETGDDPVRRRAAIASLSKTRTFLFCCSLVQTVLAALIIFGIPDDPLISAMTFLSATCAWVGVFQVNAKLQFLTLLDKLSRDERPVV